MSTEDFRIYGMTQQIMVDFWLRHHSYLPNEHLTFDRAKNAWQARRCWLMRVNERLYLGFNRKGACGL